MQKPVKKSLGPLRQAFAKIHKIWYNIKKITKGGINMIRLNRIKESKEQISIVDLSAIILSKCENVKNKKIPLYKSDKISLFTYY